MNITATLIGQSLTFAVFVWFCMKFIWPPVRAAMSERQKAIAEGLAASEQAEARLADASSAAETELEKAKEDFQRNIEEKKLKDQLVFNAGMLFSRTTEADELMELARLRKENQRLRMERDILKKATAFFASERN